jgi:hypothetical protein
VRDQAAKGRMVVRLDRVPCSNDAWVDGAPVRPVIGPARAVRIGGRSGAVEPVGRVGLTPTIEWTAPASGTASGYTVVVIWFMPPALVARTVAVLVTTDTTVTLPPGILQIGERYAVSVRAHALPASIDLTRAPLRRTIPESYADTLTGSFVP